MVASLTSKSMELEGNLKAFQLADILRFLAMGKMSGMLTFNNNERTIKLTIRDGAIIGAAAGDRFPRLGQMLVYNGLLTRKQLDEVLESQRDATAPRMLGEILVEKGWVPLEQVEAALKLQIREDLWDLFSWSDGQFKFEHGLRPGQHRAMVTLEIEPLIDEGLQQLEHWQVISSNLGDPNLVFRVALEISGPPEVRLNPNTWRVLSLINGRHSINVLMYLSGLGRFETVCALDRLLQMQMIEPLPGYRRPAYAPGRPGDSGAAPMAEPRAASENDTEPDTLDDNQRRGLFGKLRRSSRKEQAAEAQPAAEERRATERVGGFDTNVSLACAVINRLAARLCAEGDFRGEGGPTALIESLWREIGMRFPRADLIAPREGRLDAAPFEAYVRIAGGVSDYLAGCLEDSMESLTQLGERLARMARERLGERARKLVAETVKPYLDCTEIKYSPDFAPRQWTEQWMKALG